jgi:hypothetical protein
MASSAREGVLRPAMMVMGMRKRAATATAWWTHDQAPSDACCTQDTGTCTNACRIAE